MFRSIDTAEDEAGDDLRRMIGDAEPFALTGMVVAEVLQGLPREVRRTEAYLPQWDLLDPRGFLTYQEAVAIFWLYRSKGVSLTTTDARVGAIGPAHRASVFTLDKDFTRMARWTGLK